MVVEGVRLVEEAQNAGCDPDVVLYTEDLNPRGEEIVSAFRSRGITVHPVAAHVMQAASDTHSPQGILAVLPWSSNPLPDDGDYFLVLDGIRDPGNLGTILRTALGAGVDAVLVPPGSADITAPKVVRAGMGAHFRLAIHSMTWEAICDLSVSRQITSYLADSNGGQAYYQSDFKIPLILAIGGEAAGAGQEAQQLATHRVHIPMTGQVESLNAAAAAAVLMFEVRRQRGA